MGSTNLGSGFVRGGRPEALRIIGENSADNDYDSSLVAADRDGSILERLEELADDTDAILGTTQSVEFRKSASSTRFDEDGGRGYFAVSIVDRDVGDVASANIDITSATATLAKSTGGAAFATAGIAQPTLAKANGRVDLDFDFDAAEWTTGDAYKVTITGVTATDSGGNAVHMGQVYWIGSLDEATDVKTTVDDIDTDLGEPGDANSAATVHGRHAVPDADAVTNAHMRDVVGNKSDAGSAGATASTHALARLLVNVYAGTTGTADSGSSATLVDAALTQADADYWAGQMLVMLTGNAAGQARTVLNFDAGTDTLTIAPAFTAAIATGDEYVIVSYDNSQPFSVALNNAALTIATNSLADQVYVGAAEQLRAFIAKTGGTAVAATKSLVDALGHDGTTDLDTGLMAQLQDYVVDDAASLYNRLGDPTGDTLTSLTAKLGAGNEAADESAGAAAFALLRAVLADVDKLGDTALDGTETAGSAYERVHNLDEDKLTTARAGYLDQYWRLDPDPVTAASDASVGSGAEENLLDVGADAGSTAYRLESALCNVASLGTNTTITFRVKAEINGTLTQIGNDVDRTGTGAFDLMSVLGITNVAARHLRVTVLGDNAADDGSVAATFVTSIAGV